MTTGGTFRADIQGMRALAVLLVALAHAQVGPFVSGFIGVDVFFVISGFLITQLLLTEARGTGGISISGFYARRARRILPAATLVLVVTIVVAASLLSRVDAANVAVDAVWAALFVANVKFARDGTDYFAEDTPASLLQHYWSLSVEEQFYLVWPLLLAAIVLVARRRGDARRASGDDPGGDRLVRPAVVVLGVVVVVSFAWSVVLTGQSQVSAYFSTPARVWELGLGALGALAVPVAGRLPGGVRTLMSWAGLAGVLWASLSIREESFPGWIAVVPVAGTLLLLLGGTGPAPAGPQRLLTLTPMRRVGDWSYSFYLWHWPALMVTSRLWGEPSGATGLLVLAVALALSALTYRFVENPFRRPRRARATGSGPAARPRAGNRSGNRSGLVLYPVAVGVTLALALGSVGVLRHVPVSGAAGPAITVEDYGQDPGDPRVRFSDKEAVALVQASALATRNRVDIPADLDPDPLDLASSVPSVGECDYFRWPNEQLCRRGDVDAERTMVVVGDSHARAWIPALEQAATRHGWATYYLVKQGCTGSDVVPWNDERGVRQGCLDFRAWAFEQVDRIDPALTVLASDAPRELQLPDGSVTSDDEAIAAAMERGTTRTIERLRGSTDRLVVVGDIPGTDEHPAMCLSARDATLLGCAAPPEGRGSLMNDATERAAARTGVPFVDPTRWFCAYGLCPAVVGDTITLRDLEHISVSYSESLARPLGHALGLDRAGPRQSSGST